MQELNYFMTLSSEVRLNIYSFFDEKTCGTASQVGKLWEKECQTDHVWKCIFPGIETVTSNKFKFYVKEHNLKKIDSLLDLRPHLESFCKRVQTLQVGAFKCLFPYNAKCVASIDINLSGQPATSACYRETYLLTAPLDEDVPGERTTLQARSSIYKSFFSFPQSKPITDIAYENVFDITDFDIFNALSHDLNQFKAAHERP